MLSVLLPRIPLTRILTTHALRAHAPTAALTFPHRDFRHAQFSTTPRRSATEEPTAQAVIEAQQKFARIFKDKPELQELVLNLKTTLEKEGVDVQNKGMPSKMDMFRILMKPDVRDAVMKVSAAFQEAGINPKEMLEDMAALQKYINEK